VNPAETLLGHAMRSRNFEIVLVAALVLCLGVLYFVASEPPPQSGRIVLRAGAALPTPAGSESAAPASSSELQRMINGGQFDPPPGNPEKMYSIAPPFSNTASAASSPAGNGQGKAVVQAGLAVLGASTWSTPPTQEGSKSPSTTIEVGPHTIQTQTQQTQTQSIEFETPPGIGSSKGGQ